MYLSVGATERGFKEGLGTEENRPLKNYSNGKTGGKSASHRRDKLEEQGLRVAEENKRRHAGHLKAEALQMNPRNGNDQPLTSRRVGRSRQLTPT